MIYLFAADENFNNDILGGIQSRYPSAIDVVRVQDTEILGAPDEVVLEWAARHGRILLTHDVKTMMPLAYARIGEGLPMPGVIEVPASVSVAEAIYQLSMIIEASTPDEWADKVTFIPL